MIGCLRTCVGKQPIIALYFDAEPVLKFYNLEARPIKQAMHRVPVHMQDEVDRQRELMLEHIIQPYASPWPCNIVLVKKDRSRHFCIDFSCRIDQDTYLLLKINRSLNQLVGSKWCS